MLNDQKYSTQDSPWAAMQPKTMVSADVTTYLKQIYAMLAASLIVAVAAGYVGMSLPFAREHPIILLLLMFGALFLAFKVQNAVTLFLFTGLSGLSLGPVIAHYVGAGMSHIVGQAAFLTGAVFTGLSVYSLTTKRDLSMMGGMLFAGLIVIVVGGLINLFVQSSAVSFAISGLGSVIFAGYILFETQQLKENPWAMAPSVAALSMYLNVVNLFTSLLRLLGFLGGDE
ncbi:MAG: Bax inhibitor-1/YccA family protein [Magnetococcales bacterium]|nr:Bax inhibitor-1/YccA family protein [Magnetococcales bacterium]NGZ05543.1 Bax inhibitor-1/YccA family protein [Magnetococcales bacterium]